MVLVFDGEEGGDHNTWEYLHVTDRDDSDPAGVVANPEQTAHAPAGGIPDSVEVSADEPANPWDVALGAGVAGLVIGAVVAAATVRRRNA
jgi:hypothetical protein